MWNGRIAPPSVPVPFVATSVIGLSSHIPGGVFGPARAVSDDSAGVRIS